MNEYKRLTIRNSDGSVSQPTHSTFEKVFNRLAELEDKIDQGTLIELPCKVGDKVNKVMPIGGVRRIVEFTVSRISITNEVSIFFKKNKDSWHEWCTKPKHIGETVFLTREEAEAKLKELQE